MNEQEVCPIHVLLVDDNDAIRGLVRSILSSEGIVVLEASDGKEALEVSRSHQGPIHVLLTDVLMPGLSGVELAGHLVQERPGVNVILMSSEEPPVGTLAAVFLQKPFSPGRLLANVWNSAGNRANPGPSLRLSGDRATGAGVCRS
jgi:two-component system cell cycle sensor histidine kinase/response regulator CckA